jgi:hypothetical protein
MGVQKKKSRRIPPSTSSEKKFFYRKALEGASTHFSDISCQAVSQKKRGPAVQFVGPVDYFGPEDEDLGWLTR